MTGAPLLLDMHGYKIYLKNLQKQASGSDRQITKFVSVVDLVSKPGASASIDRERQTEPPSQPTQYPCISHCTRYLVCPLSVTS